MKTHCSSNAPASWSSALALALLATCCLLGPTARAAAVLHDMSAEFSPTENPAGAWSYGWTSELGGPFSPITAHRMFGAMNGMPLAAWEMRSQYPPAVIKNVGADTAVSGQGKFTGPPGIIYFTPGVDNSPQNFGVIRFTVPADEGGNYQLATAVSTLMSGPQSADAEFHVVVNGREVFARFLDPNGAGGYTNTLALRPGDTVDFASGRGADGLTADTGLKIQATFTPSATPLGGTTIIPLLSFAPSVTTRSVRSWMPILLGLAVAGINTVVIAVLVYLLVQRSRRKNAAPAPIAAPPGLEEELRSLARLKAEGIITEEEFTEKKRALLGL